MVNRLLLPLTALLCCLVAVALIATAQALNPDPLPTRAAVTPESLIVYRDVPITVTPSPRPTRAPTLTPPPFKPSPIPTATESFWPERQTYGRSETS